MEDPSLYRVLFLIARALVRLNTIPSRLAGLPAQSSERGFVLTGKVILPPGPFSTDDAAPLVPTAEACSLSHHYAEMLGTIAVSPDCTDTVTISVYRAGRRLRTFQLTEVSTDGGWDIRNEAKLPGA